MSKRAYFVIAGLILLALLALLVYSLDRTSWLLAQYELSQPGTLAAWLGLAPLALGVAAALVIEIGAVALVGGDVLARSHPEIRRYASAGLLVVLAVQALANLLAGFVRGYQAMLATLTAHDASADIAWWVAGLSWLLSSIAVPALIFILSKLAAHTLRLALEAQPAQESEKLSAPLKGSEPSPDEVSIFQTPKRLAGFVYVLQSTANGCKIGCTQDVTERCSEIAAFIPFPVEVVHTVATDDMYATERRIHRYFETAGKRINGEWFALSSVDLSAIKAIPDQDIDQVFGRALGLLALAGGTKDPEFDGAFWLQQASAKVPLVLSNGHVEPSASSEEVQAPRYTCPHCQAPLASKQAVGAAVKNNYCPNCKAERKAA